MMTCCMMGHLSVLAIEVTFTKDLAIYHLKMQNKTGSLVIVLRY